MKSDLITVEGNNVIQIDKKTLDMKVSTFCIIFCNPQKNKHEKYSTILNSLDVSPHLVANTYAKQSLESACRSEQEFYPSREEASSSSRSKSVHKKNTKKQRPKRRTKKRPVRRNGLSFDESKNLD